MDIKAGRNHVDSRQRTGWWQVLWLVPTAAVLLDIVIIPSVPPYLTFDPAKQEAPINPGVPGLDYSLIVGHALFGTVALVTVCLAVWPWLRVRHPAIHRWSGRFYVYFGALPSAVLSSGVNYLHRGWHGDIGAYAEGVVWFVTTLIGQIAARQGNYLRHRRWMLYSFAMATSVIWGPLALLVLPSPAEFGYVIELTRWAGWLLNLLVIKWWLDRTDRQGTVVLHAPARKTHSVLDRRS